MKKFNALIMFFQTEDLEKTTDFYHELLNCKMILDQGPCRIFKTTKGAFLGFCTHSFLKKEKNSFCITFVCESKEEVNWWYEHLRKNNIPTKEPPKESQQFNIYNFFATDPNGITIEIQYFLHPFPSE